MRARKAKPAVAGMIFDTALMSAPSFLECFRLRFPVHPADGVTVERAADLHGPMFRIGLIAGRGL
jgi:hypothetical protein